MTRSGKVTILLLAVAVAAPAIAWVSYKPVRILAPEFNGVACKGRVCVEDPDQLSRAELLQLAAVAQVGSKLVPLDRPPLTIFCSTRKCYHSFGGGMERGATLFNWGVILPPESWVPHIVEHEYIHMLQAQELGLVGRQRTPDWFKEGMPFHLSQPPEYDLPAYARPLADHYEAWERQVGRLNAWQAVREI
jgi:hypothetical protein